jgi:hypothetical protein
MGSFGSRTISGKRCAATAECVVAAGAPGAALGDCDGGGVRVESAPAVGACAAVVAGVVAAQPAALQIATTPMPTTTTRLRIGLLIQGRIS